MGARGPAIATDGIGTRWSWEGGEESEGIQRKRLDWICE